MKKRLIVVALIITFSLIIGMYVYSTFAYDIKLTQNNNGMADLEYTFNIGSNTLKEVTVTAGETKLIELTITNPNNGNIAYGVYYEKIDPLTLPNTVTIVQDTSSINQTTGTLNKGQKISVTVKISNNSSSDITIKLGVCGGYENGGELPLKDGQVIVPPPPPASETIKDLSSGDSWESGASGVYATNSYTDTDGSTKYHEYRYIGANVNNYVSFNNDMYQIIGVFDSNSHGRSGEYLVKLIAVNPLGGNSWGIYNTSATSGSYSNYSNDWTGTSRGVKANLNVLLNEYFVNKAVTSSTYGNCSNWTYYLNNTNYRTNDCSDIVGYGINSSLRDYIETTTWYLYGSGSDQSKQNWYICERGGNSCTSANSGAYSSTTDAQIGLMYVSDYLYASGYYSSSDTTGNSKYYYGNQNWLYSGYEWTITPYASNSFNVWCVAYGRANNYHPDLPYVLRPSFYLKSSIYITGGSGTFDDPYTIGCNDCTI